MIASWFSICQHYSIIFVIIFILPPKCGRGIGNVHFFLPVARFTGGGGECYNSAYSIGNVFWRTYGWNFAAVRLFDLRNRAGGRAGAAGVRTDPAVAGAVRRAGADDVDADGVCVFYEIHRGGRARRRCGPGRHGGGRGAVHGPAGPSAARFRRRWCWRWRRR